jgi:AcrR family transcriptional regulator
MPDTTEQNSRTRILNAAEAVFAERGFDGARVDAIAKRAGVNKALIYYYFDSKDAILDELLRRFVEGTYPIKSRAVDYLASSDERDVVSSVDSIYHYFKENRRIASVLLMEILRETPRLEGILRYLDSSSQLGRSMLEERGMTIEPSATLTGFVLFAELIPMAFFSLIGERWSEDADAPYAEIQDLMMQHFRVTYESVIAMYLQGQSKGD